MPGPINFPEWLNANSLRAYPIQEDASRASESGEVALPNELVVDARFNVPDSYIEGHFFVSAVELVPDRVTVSISYWENDVQSLVATIVALLSTHTRNQVYLFQGAGTNSSVMGAVTIGKIEEAIARVQGAFTFDHLSTVFEPTTMYVSQPMVERIVLSDKGHDIATLSGVIRFKGGSNVRLTRIDAETIRIDAISGENLTDCPDPTAVATPIRTINGVPPNDSGDFWIKGSECLSVGTLSAHSLELRDLCSSSCCGCTEMESILSALRRFETQQSDLRNEIYRVYTESSTALTSLTTFLAV